MTVPITEPSSAAPDDDIDLAPDGRTTNSTSRWQKVVGVIGLLVVMWVGKEMYDVVFFDGTFAGGGQHTPVDNQDEEVDTDEIDTDDDGDHTPPPGGHG